jgi:hypothetical protein
MSTSHARRLAVATALCAAFALGASPARAHPVNASDASALSLLPVAVSVAAPALVLSGTAMLTVVAVEASAKGTVWVLERASDGARLSVTLAASAAGGVSVATGAAVTVSVVGAGWVLSTAGRAIAFIPNEIGAALLYNERVTR